MSSTNVSDSVDNVNIEVPVGKKIGRPTKKALAAAKNKGKVGRPAGEAAIINEMKARLIASPKSKKVLDSILNAALDDDHRNQSAAWKLLMDRMLPVSMFEKDKGGGARPSVNITISGVGGTTTISEDIEDADYEVEDDV